jgi:hypothetical protein
MQNLELTGENRFNLEKDQGENIGRGAERSQGSELLL